MEPFYAAMPTSTIDLDIVDSLTELPIEERGLDEVTNLQGQLENGEIVNVKYAPMAQTP